MIVAISMPSSSTANGIDFVRAKMFIEGLLEERLEIEEKKKQFSVILSANNEMKKTNFTLKLNIFFFIFIDFITQLYNKKEWSGNNSEFETEMISKFAFRILFLMVIGLFKCILLTLVMTQLFTKKVQNGSL
jgi:hypothetical protein